MYFHLVEIITFGFFALFLRHAHGKGMRWFWTLIWGALFGLVVEVALVTGNAASYSYGHFLVMVPWNGHEVPLWVGLGWGAILYAATWTAQRLAQPWYVRPLTAALLAVNIDLSLDPIAQELGFWTWTPEVGRADYYGVPFDNFLGWFAIVASYSLFVRGIFRKVKARWGADHWVPPVSALCALAVLYVLHEVFPPLYATLGGQATAFAGAFGIALAVAAGYALASRRDHPLDLTILSLPVCYHALVLGILLHAKSYNSAQLATLLVVIPLNLIVGFIAYAWVSLDRVMASRDARATPIASAAPPDTH